jgi:hypothetical protein
MIPWRKNEFMGNDSLQNQDGATYNSTRTTSPFEAEDNQFQCFQRKGLYFLHLNARSLLPKLDEVRILATKSKPVVIGITETWLDKSVEDSEVEILGYIIHRQDRKRNLCGVCMFIQPDLAFSPRPDLTNDASETVWVEIPLTRLVLF